MKKRIVTFIAAAAMTLTFSASAFAATGTVERSVNFRSSPSTNGSVYQLLKPGTTFTALNKVNAWWYQVQVNGKTGYVSSGYVNVPSSSQPSQAPTPDPTPAPQPSPTPSPAPSPSGTKADKVIADAKALIGKVKYVYGKNEAPSVMDCSAFTKYVFGQEGITLSWGTRYQKDAGTFVERANLQPGDLVFFRVGSSTSIGHVGIYLGNGQFIHNSPSNKGGVGIGSMTSGYWKDRYVTGRRVV
ncbi:C40 family peptidase [Gordoniibacillus kamchatkensis]|uniref:C40 family peptidase n=1 Tax=Gordoniibacillus kamchatkensis TaxID=1590651 RepID=UPI000698A94F|nr:SH3 domain-containing C40 family peptidase [Paenibacillus sp. VKM B-2647]